jgi:Na+/phosphate symporter
MSGSPVAAIALSLFSGGTISDVEAFAMINGTRLGASFIVLFVGFLYYVSRRRDPDSIYIGVVALMTAFTLWAPVIPLGWLALRAGWFDGMRFGSPGALVSVIDLVYDPLTTRAKEALPALALFAFGVPALLGAFYLFDRALPNLESPGPTFERLSRLARGRLAMFGFGAAVTLLTLSVSLSLTILVPLTLKGYVRRNNLIPYIMGANIATWVDTMFAALLLDEPRAFTIVFTMMAVGAGISLFVLFFAYWPYSNAILALAHRATSSRRGFAAFLGAILVLPALLLVV